MISRTLIWLAAPRLGGAVVYYPVESCLLLNAVDRDRRAIPITPFMSHCSNHDETGGEPVTIFQAPRPEP